MYTIKKFLTLIVALWCIIKHSSAQDSLLWSLQECISYAVTNNINIKKNELNNITASVNYEQQKNNKLPSLSSSNSFSFSHGSSVDPITSSFVDKNIISNSYGLNGQFVIYQGNRLQLQIEKNALLVNQSLLYTEEAKNSIKLSVMEAYLQALYYREGITIAENAVASSKEEVQQARIKYTNGAIAQKDLADVETQHAANEYGVVSANNLYSQQVLKLKQLLELEPSIQFSIIGVGLSDKVNIIPDKKEVFAAAQVLPDLKIYDVQSDILTRELQIAKASQKPTVSLNAGINTGYTNTMNYNYFTQLYRNFSQQLSLSVNIPIFSKKENKTNIQLAKINLEQNNLDKVAASKTLYANIETARQNAVLNQAQQISAKKSEENAKLAYDLARKKYEFGGLTTTELAVSRNAYLSAAQTYLQNKYLAVLYSELLNFYQGKNIVAN